jgi:glycosyltransferase involved in cell wall biosynthesis
LTKEGLDLEVWYCSNHGLSGELDKEFNQKVKWDIPLLQGYAHLFLKNSGSSKGIYAFGGLINWELRKKIKQLSHNDTLVVHGWNYFSYLFAILLGIIYGKKVSLRLETPWNQVANQLGLKHRLKRATLKHLLFKRISYFFYMGNQNKLFYTQLGVPESKLYFTPYCVDNNRFQNEASKLNKNKLRDQYKIPQKSRVFLFSGKYIDKKRPLDLIKAAQQVKVGLPSYYVFMGDGALRKEMELMIQDIGSDNILLTGFVNQSEVSAYYAMSDVFVMCSGSGETWGLSTNEAMNFGMPVILSMTCGSAYDLVNEDENGDLFNEGDVLQLTALLEKYIQLPLPILEKMGENSLSTINQYSYSEVKNGLIDAIQ